MNLIESFIVQYAELCRLHGLYVSVIDRDRGPELFMPIGVGSNLDTVEEHIRKLCETEQVPVPPLVVP